MIHNWKSFNEEHAGRIPIKDMEGYISRMDDSYADKLFFLNKVKFDVVVDFGCADGFILKKIKEVISDVKLIGYDSDLSMAKEDNDILFTNNWNEVLEIIKDYESPLLILSSVIHEVYSYSELTDVKNFWSNVVFNNKFKYIAIRDMIISDKSKSINYDEDLEKVLNKADKEQLKSFEYVWGNISKNYKTLIHFLLKYRYKENWDREVYENYHPISLEILRQKVPNNYKITFEDTFILPFLDNELQKDFGIRFKHPTHLKMIIERN